MDGHACVGQTRSEAFPLYYAGKQALRRTTSFAKDMKISWAHIVSISVLLGLILGVSWHCFYVHQR